MSEINCNNCAISDFKESLCKRCDKMKRIGSADDIEKLIIECLPSVQLDVPDKNVGDTISRQAAIRALWKALYEYEDKTEKQFIDSEELDVADWIQHRIFVQNMSDIDRQTILGLPSVQPEQWIPCSERLPDMWDESYLVSLAWGGVGVMEYKSTGFHNYGSFTPVPIESVIAWMPRPEPYKGEQE